MSSKRVHSSLVRWAANLSTGLFLLVAAFQVLLAAGIFRGFPPR